MSAVDVRALSMWYGDFQALHEVTLSVRAKAVTALVGPSGCGKTTLLKCLMRLHERTAQTRTTGQVEVLGHDILAPGVSVHELRRHVGLVFQRPNPLPLSVFDNVAFAARLFEAWPAAQVEARVREALQRVGLWSALEGRLHQSALELSLEQQQRLCIARLLPLQPAVLLMDEPCSTLDPKSTEAVEQLMRELCSEYTIIIVTHSMAQARRVADECAFMLMGHLVEHGPTAQLFTDARDERTRDYLSGKFG